MPPFFIPCVKANLKNVKMKKATWYNSKYCDVKNINIKKRLAVKDKPFQYSYLVNYSRLEVASFKDNIWYYPLRSLILKRCPYSFRLVHSSLYSIGYFYPQLYFNIIFIISYILYSVKYFYAIHLIKSRVF